MRYIACLLVVLGLGAVGHAVLFRDAGSMTESSQKINVAPLVGASETPVLQTAPMTEHLVGAPIEDALSRVTKKSFGVYIDQKNSPVSPERFRGFHVGADFETTTDEQSVDIPVYAICAGPLVLKKWATGYGGVAVQSCRLDGADVTVVYGHLRLSSVTSALGQRLAQGERLGVLGKGYSTETDNERKHLHLGIHKGAIVDIKGYVQDKSALGQWIDVMTHLQP